MNAHKPEERVAEALPAGVSRPSAITMAGKENRKGKDKRVVC